MIVFPGGRLTWSRIRFYGEGKPSKDSEVPCVWQYKGAIRTISRLEKTKKRENLLELKNCSYDCRRGKSLRSYDLE